MTSSVCVTNATRSTVIAARCAVARSFFARTKGLMGHPGLEPDTGLVIKPCSSIHTFFMRFPIDVIFFDRNGVVVGTRAAMPPGLPYAGARKAHAVVELPAGSIAASRTEIGDRLQFDPPLR